ncbi:hypothetical protein G7B40_030675 [Aetokthonos hydrillicola Thurmond2011]|uniref:Uncharacterized protein n=1 Tax=Aetokthonos hydrillicola Thurmond2011 TaxID=2712845 RepID=A0AAP5ICW1_9CYAN|nr:hypothetical protein [Aetokthonos hydrillicola]MBW4583915.1 hypothetical protein [Aetokthonos hydrillicola CCALA 1050]MDR9898889.1 hypothetical protein [Aetokthonos hydrillicola Thurmond2011]
MRAKISLFVTGLLLSLLVCDYQVIASNVTSTSTSSSQQLLSAKAKKTKKQPTPYRGSGRRGEDGMI